MTEATSLCVGVVMEKGWETVAMLWETSEAEVTLVAMDEMVVAEKAGVQWLRVAAKADSVALRSGNRGRIDRLRIRWSRTFATDIPPTVRNRRSSSNSARLNSDWT